MASTTPVRRRVTVKIKAGERLILPSDAAIISITEVDGADATSLCDLPEPTPTRKVTYFFDRRTDEGGDITIYIDSFVLGDNKVRFSGLSQDTTLNTAVQFIRGIYSVAGVVKLYVCTDCAGSGCNNAVTIEIPENLEDPYFIFNFDEGGADFWFTRVYPIDMTQPGQVPRAECGTYIAPV